MPRACRSPRGAKRRSRAVLTMMEGCERGRKGFQTAVTEATGAISQYIFRKYGFVDRLTISYKTFEYLGSRVFASIEGHMGTILMDKVLR